MPLTKCNICSQEFYSKPSHQIKGWGKFCSKACHIKSQFNGQLVKCFICGRETYRSKSHLNKSSSGKYFCTKSCQTLWRNQLYVGEKSINWKNGERAYRQILKRSGRKAVCALCKISDERVLIAHHKDNNRENNRLENLIWLCFNCHFLIHHYRAIKEKLL